MSPRLSGLTQLLRLHMTSSQSLITMLLSPTQIKPMLRVLSENQWKWFRSKMTQSALQLVALNTSIQRRRDTQWITSCQTLDKIRKSVPLTPVLRSQRSNSSTSSPSLTHQRLTRRTTLCQTSVLIRILLTPRILSNKVKNLSDTLGPQPRTSTVTGTCQPHSLTTPTTITTEMYSYNLTLRMIQSALQPVALNTSTQRRRDIQWITSCQTLVKIRILVPLNLVLRSQRSNSITSSLSLTHQRLTRRTTLCQTSVLIRILLTPRTLSSKVKNLLDTLGPQPWRRRNTKWITSCQILEKIRIWIPLTPVSRLQRSNLNTSSPSQMLESLTRRTTLCQTLVPIRILLTLRTLSSKVKKLPDTLGPQPRTSTVTGTFQLHSLKILTPTTIEMFSFNLTNRMIQSAHLQDALNTSTQRRRDTQWIIQFQTLVPTTTLPVLTTLLKFLRNSSSTNS